MARCAVSATNAEVVSAVVVSGVGQPLTPAQQRLYFLHELAPDDPAYTVAMAVTLDGPLDVVPLRHAIDAVVRRHDGLRSRFAARWGDDGTPAPRRFATEPGPAVVRMVDLSHLADADADAVLRRTIDTILRRPLDIAAGPIARWTVFRLGPLRHVLHLAVHHIVFDRASLAVLGRDLESVCLAATAGEPASLAPLGPAPSAPPPDRVSADVAFWVDHLGDAAPQRPLWSDGDSAVPLAVTAGDRLPDLDVRRLAAVAAERGSTPFALVAAALAVAVGQYTGQDDVVIGTPVALDDTVDRDRVDLLINLVPLRIRVPRRATFAEVVADARRAALDALDHRHAPFERVVDALRLPRDPTATPIFRVLLAYQASPHSLRIPAVATTLLPTAAPAAKYHLTVTVTESPDGLDVDVEADARETSGATVAAFVRHLTGLLARAVAAPGAGLSDLLRPDRPLRTSSRPARRPPAREQCGLHTLVERSAAAVPDAIAVRTADGQLTYRSLDRRANQIARHLRAHGAGRGAIVAVRLVRDLHLVPLLLGVLKAGAAYLPLDLGAPAARLRAIVDDARPDLMIVTSGDTVEFAGPVLTVDDPGIAELPTTPPCAVPHPAELAYVLHTSGSSGVPKGVAIEHGSAVEFVRWAMKVFSIDELAGTLAVTSLGFDLSVFELFVPLAAGGTVLLTGTAPNFGPLITSDRATVLNTVPSVLSAMLDGDVLPPTLRAVNLAGEPLTEELVTRLAAVAPDVVVRNLYGPSEATTYATGAVVRSGEPPAIGSAVADARVWLTDPMGVPVPRAATGEIRIGGGALARGYLGSPGSTAASFVPDSLDLEAGRRLYRTGDLARIDHRGELRFVGRADHQVKIRGVRIEPEEIETQLLGHPGVREAAVVATPTTPPRLVAFICSTVDGTVCRDELAAHLRAVLPAPMVPESWSMLTTLPRTTNGKVDRRALLRHAVDVRPPASGSTAPRSTLERAIADEWCTVLARQTVGAHDGFFDIGGNSLLLLALVHRLRETVDPGLRLVDVFRFPTVASLAAHLRRDTGEPDAPVARGTAAGQRRRAAIGRRVERGR